MFIYPSDTIFFVTLKKLVYMADNLHPFSISSKHSQLADKLGPQYQGLLDANPYRGQRYEKSPWQNILTALGFRTQADAWAENMNVQAAEYDAAIAQKAYDEQYNSATAQAERLRAAGVNPDISGGENISPGEAASLPQDPSTPMQSTGQEEALGQVASFASTIMSCFSTAVGMVQSFQGIYSNRLDNTIKSFKTEGEFQKFVREIAPQLTPDSPEDDVLEDGETQTWEYRAWMMAKMFAKKNLPRKFRQKFVDSIYQFWNSAEARPMVFEKWMKGIQNEKGYESERNTWYSPERRVLRSLYKRLGEAKERIDLLLMKQQGTEAEAATSEAALRDDIATNTDGKAIGEARSAEAKLEKETAENTDGKTLGEAATNKAKADSLEDQIRAILKETIRDITKDLSSQGTLVADATALSVELADYLPQLLSIKVK